MEKDSPEMLAQYFRNTVKEMEAFVDIYDNQAVTAQNVFQPAKLTNRDRFQKFMNYLIRPESKIIGKENILEFYKNFQAGKSSLILGEHKSNFDVPGFCAMMYREENPVFSEIFEKIVFVAGRKLNEDSIFVKIIAETFNRVIVVPKGEGQVDDKEEQRKILEINMATQRFIRNNKDKYIFLVYPTGTRSRPWDRNTYKGIKEVYNYLKNFEQIIYLSINGNCLPPTTTGMAWEIPKIDQFNVIFSKPVSGKELIQNGEKEFQGEKESFKQFLIDKVMDQIYGQKGIMPWDEK
ncbi:MAG TPA: hypothetical protein DHW82_01745 [Spirochaetia bacterium]|nr:MAG: hypothetical protein A2Y41_13790 [Spirochaetes bacterium GWB1_36_13]HCL55718.1 hypothetical protein [Spirochaetia bacterium]